MLSKDGTLFEKWIKEALKMFKKMSLKKMMLVRLLEVAYNDPTNPYGRYQNK